MQLKVDVVVTRAKVAGETEQTLFGSYPLTQSWIDANPPGTFVQSLKSEKVVVVPDGTNDTQLQAFADAAVIQSVAGLPTS